MVNQIRTLIRQYRELPETSRPKVAIAAGKNWALGRRQQWQALPTNRRQKIVGVTCGGICVLGLIGLAMPEPRSQTNDSPTVISHGNRSPLTKSGYIGTWSESDLDLVLRSVNTNDTETIARLMVEGRAFWIPAGQAVEIRGQSGLLGSRIKIRYNGDRRYFYTVTEAVSQ